MEVLYGVTMMFGVSKNERKPHRKSPLTSLDENNFSFFFKSSFPLWYDCTFSFSNRLLFNLPYVRLPIFPLMVHFSFSFKPPFFFSTQSHSLTLHLPFLVSFYFLSSSLSPITNRLSRFSFLKWSFPFPCMLPFFPIWSTWNPMQNK